MARLTGVLCWFVVLSICLPAMAAPVLIKAGDDGAFSANGVPFRLLLQRGSEVVSNKDIQPADGFPKTSEKVVHLKGTVRFQDGDVEIDQTIEKSPAARVTVQLKSAKPIECDTAALVAILPSADYAGRSLTYNGGASPLPKEPDETVLLWKAGIAAIGIPLAGDGDQCIYLHGKLDSCVADQRKWNDQSFGLRVLMRRDKPKGAFTSASLSFVITTDAMPPQAEVPQEGLPYDVAQWVAPHWNTSARVIPSDDGQAIEIHTKQRDWNQYLTYRLRYPRDVARCVFTGRLKTTGVAGGTAPIEAARAQLVFRNASGDQIGGWPASTVQGGTQDWTAFQQDHTTMPPGVRFIDVCIGLYVSTGTATYDKLNLLAYDASGAVVERIPVPLDEVTDTTGWYEFHGGAPDGDQPAAIDLAQFIPKPAGQFGAVVVKDGHFAFEGNGQRIRFWGTGWDHRGTPEQNAAVAKQLRRMGINLVRFHSLDGPFLDKALWLNPSVDTQKIDPAKLDSFDNLVAALEAEGIYVDINLLAYRPFTAADGVKDAAGLTGGGGVAAMFDPTLIALQKQYARQLLDRVNPYTGRRYADDPGLAMIELKNETSFHLMDFMGGVPQSYRDDLNTQFRQWLGSRRTLTPAQRFEQMIRDRDADAIGFSQYLTRSYVQQMRQFLRGEMGLKCPIAATQALGWDVDDLAAAASEADYIDTHGYWDHPAGGWDPTSLYQNRSIFGSPDKNFLAEASACRVAGKPMSMSEWNFCWPNEFIAEGPLTVAAVALRNDWDAAMGFGFDGTGFGKQMESTFKADNKPQFALPFQLAALAFHRGDLSAAPATVINVPKPQSGAAKSLFPASTLFANPSLNFNPEAAVAAAVPTATSAQATWDAAKGRCMIDSPRLQAVIGAQQVGLATTDVGFDSDMPFAQLAVTSLDGKPIRDSGDLLICAIARAENTDQRYRLFRKGLTQLGHGPVLLEPIRGTITLAADDKRKPVIHVLNAYGQRTGEIISVAKRADRWVVALDAIQGGWVELTQ